MVEAGADEIPEDTLLEALELAHEEIRALRGPGGARAQAGKPKWLDAVADRGAQELARRRDPRADPHEGLREAAARSRRSSRELCPELTMESNEEDIVRQVQVRQSLNTLLETLRLEAVEAARPRAVRGRAAGADRRRAGLEGARSAKRSLLFDRILERRRAAVPGRPRRRRGRGRGQGLDDEAVRQACRRGDLQGPRPQEDRGREAASGRPRHRGDPPDRVRGRRLAADARIGPLHPRADADHDPAHARHRQGGAADRRPLARDRSGGTCTTTTSRPTRSARPGSCAGRSAATSVTVHSRSGRSSR